MEKFLTLAGAVALGVFLAMRFRNSAALDASVTIGTKRVAVSRAHDTSGAWKKDYPVLTNQFGSRPYGASGLYAGAYIDNDSSTLH